VGKITGLIFGCLLANVALADSSQVSTNHDGFVIGISGEPTWTSGSRSQTLTVSIDNLKTYTTSESNNPIANIGVFLGWQNHFLLNHFKHPFLTQLGLSVSQASTAKLSGNIWEDADPAFDNYQYSYKVNHTFVGITGRLVSDCDFILNPYLAASIGVGLNRAYQFTINPIISNEVPAPAFGDKTNSTLSYTLGIGLQKSFQQWQIAVGYEFGDWGKTSFSGAPGQATTARYRQQHLYTHSLQFSLFYLV
jgi:opacity protein-like surface antigen